MDPFKIACVSFTRKAAQESRERVCLDLGLEEDSLPYFQTLHSMAFRAGGYKVDDVVTAKDFIEIGKSVGLSFTNSSKTAIESDFDIIGYSKGDAYMSIYQISRSLQTSLENCFIEAEDYKLHWTELTRLVEAYEDYKKAKKKIDFTDMIEGFVKRDDPPNLDALFVDEAQDLSTLQWSMVNVLRKTPKFQIFTGDDDQAIMRFQGADVKAFLTATKKKEVLTQSYRLPKRIWDQAQRIVSQIEDRAPKTWSPKDEEGSVHYHQSFSDVPFEEGNWCVLARTNHIANFYARQLEEEGWVYSRKGKTSIHPQTYDAIMSWEDLVKGRSITVPALKNMYGFMRSGVDFMKGFSTRSKAFTSLKSDQLINLMYAQENLGLMWGEDIRWHKSLSKIDLDTKNYVLNALRRGDNVKHPRIKVSTIHSMKGGESDNVLVITDLSYASYKEYQKNPSSEHRVFYVAVTRAKKSLHILEPTTQRYYEI
jgi:superfamily I DNA/RNA helicase|tara:strand:- start:1740 stop:3179 length:1440 start_codon:yes stop_codon:yes gene_type:complete